MDYDGRHLVWSEVDRDQAIGTERFRIIALDLISGERHVRTSADWVHLADANGGRVLYVTVPEVNATGETVHLWDLASDEDQVLAERPWPPGINPCAISLPDLESDRVVWQQNPYLYVKDLTTGQVRKIAVTDTSGTRVFPQFAGNFLVYFINGLEADMRPLHAVPLAPAEQRQQPQQQIFYAVQPGDVLWRIAMRYGLAVPDLIRANNLLRPDWIYPGQKLFLPHPVSAPYQPYLTRTGDTLSGLAARFETSTQHILQVNRSLLYSYLPSSRLVMMPRGPEQVCKPDGTCLRTYAVMPGDTLWRVGRTLVTPQ